MSNESKKNRLDLLVAEKFNISRSTAKDLILNNRVFCGDKTLNKPNLKINLDSDLRIINIEKKEENFSLPIWKKEIEIVYEDEYIFVVNKPSGIIIHPTKYNEENTLANIMKGIFVSKNIDTFEDYLRNGIVHRLDKDTSGLVVVAKNKKVYEKFSNMISNKEIKRYYLALIHNHLQTKKVEIEAPLKRIDGTNKREVSKDFDAKDAKSIFVEKEKYSNFSLIECELITGRTHQIRAHLSYLKNNVINDPIYSMGLHNKFTKYGQYLVAYKIEFHHPFLNQKEIVIEIDLPIEFKEYIKKYGGL